MAVRLRQQSSAWMAPHALAAQLTAQTGQIAASGPQALLSGLSQGVGAFTQGRDKRRAEATNESRYQDSLRMRQADDARQDQRFQYGAVQDQMALNKDFKVGAELAYALDPTPENLMKVQQAESNNKALSAALAKYSGVQMPEMAQAPQGAPTGDVPPMPAAPQAPGMKERFEKVAGFESLSDAELEAVTAGLDSDLKTMDAETDVVLKVDKAKGAARMAANRTERGRLAFDLALATSVLKRREAKAKVTQTEEEAAARARGTESVKGAAEAAELERVNASNRARGLPEVGSLRQVGAVETTARVNANREDTQDFKRETIAKMEGRAKWQAEFRRQAALELEAVRTANKEPAAQARATQAAVQGQKSRMTAAKDRYDTLRKMYDDGKEVGVEFYGDADTPGAWDLYEAEREKYFAMTEATQDSAPTAAPVGGDPMAQAEAEYNALPDNEKTPEAAARIAAKYGMK